MNGIPPGICNDKFLAVPRQPNADSFYVYCTGGFRGAKARDDYWAIEPIYENAEARVKGFLRNSQFRELIRLSGLRVVGFQSSSWFNGEWHSSWRPMIPGERNLVRSPAGIWGDIAKNIFLASRADQISAINYIGQTKVATLLDDRTVEERLAQAISLSLRSLDHSVEQIAQHYNEQLVNRMYSGRVNGEKVSNTMDQELSAHVHAFFLQIGAARDYLAALIAHRLGMDASHGKIDTMNALIAKLRSEHAGREPMLDLLIKRGWLVTSTVSAEKWMASGWLKEITDLRNEIVHRRPYGSAYLERFGCAVAIDAGLGLFRFFRPILMEGRAQADVLDVVCGHYQTCTRFFFEAASLSGLNQEMMTLTDNDVISDEIIR